MKRFSIFTFWALVLAFSACAQGKSNAPADVSEQTSEPDKNPGNTINLPSDTAILAKLVSQLDPKRCKVGDSVEAQTTDDVKAGGQAVIKKGSRVIGRISELQTAPKAGGLYGVGIVFDNVVSKSGEPILLHMEIQAIAPSPNSGINPITDLPFGYSNHANANEGGVTELTSKSRGAIHLPGVELGVTVAKGTHITVLTSRSRAIQLEKGSQIVFRVVNP